MAPIEVDATAEITIRTPAPEFDAENVTATPEITFRTVTPEFVTYEVGRA